MLSIMEITAITSDIPAKVSNKKSISTYDTLNVNTVNAGIINCDRIKFNKPATITGSIPELKCSKLVDDAKLPYRGTSESAGLDLYSIETKTVIPGEVVKIRTGITVAIPINNYGQIFDRSSVAARGLIVVGGVIDSDYRGEVIIMLSNVSAEDVVVEKGERCAQLIILPYTKVNVVEGTATPTARNTSGFGSTGRK
jgi:dUTP pyrophosphatase